MKMAKLPTIKSIVSGFASKAQLNSNFETLRQAFTNTLSRDGSGPNDMNADIDMNGNDILNANFIGANEVRIGKELLTEADLADRASAIKVYKESISADGINPVFNLLLVPNNHYQTMIYIDGVYQQESSYTLNTELRTVTFSEVPEAGIDNIEVVTYLSLDLAEDGINVVSDVIYLRSPNQTIFALTVDDLGNLVVTPN